MIPGGFYVGADGTAHNANGETLMVTWIHDSLLDRTVIVDGEIFAPSDDGKKTMPKKLKVYLVGKPSDETETTDEVAPVGDNAG